MWNYKEINQLRPIRLNKKKIVESRLYTKRFDYFEEKYEKASIYDCITYFETFKFIKFFLIVVF